MKKITFILLCLAWLLPFAIQAQTATQPAGSGTASDPYQVANLENLYWVTQNSSSWDKYFIQTADINASSTSGWDGNAGFTPIGNNTTPFTGSYNGQGSVIDSLTISRSTTDYVGLFGKIDNGLVKNLGIDSANITGHNYVGILAGLVQGDTASVNRCYTSGTVSGNNVVGGCIGNNAFPATLKNCGSTASVTANNIAGGLAGSNASTINNCYATGTVTANLGAGGLVGSAAEVTNSFWDMQTSGQSVSIGGTGKTTSEMKDIDTYTNTATAGLTTAWDFIGTPNNDADTLDYWNIDTTGSINNGYPIPSWWVFSLAPSGTGTQTDPYLIATLNNLYWLSEGDGTSIADQNKYFEQTADIPAKSTEYIHGGQGFNPIGEFKGYYNGGGHTITNLYIKRWGNVGLFGKMIEGEISNLGIINANMTSWISGLGGIGTLVGYVRNAYNSSSPATITNCYASGTVTLHGSDGFSYSGGLVGFWEMRFNCNLRHSHFSGTVTTTRLHVGGLIGCISMSDKTMTIENCYAGADCNSSYSDSEGGGLVGYLDQSNGHLIINSSYSSGSVSANNEGGLVGYDEGSDRITINNCYSRSNLASGAYYYVGGLVGYTSSPLEITNSYSTGTATGGTHSGGMVGQTAGTLTATACFWDTLTSGNGVATGNATQPSGMTGKTTTEMKTQSTFTNAGWDFTDVWEMDGTTNDGYAFLQMKSFPNVTTAETSNIGIHTAQSGGTVSIFGEDSLTAEGVVWDITNDPTVTNHLGITNDGTALGTFTSTLTGLSDTTVYYVRAYATNSDGTGYGEVKTFYTQMQEPATMAPPGNALDFDGNDDYVLLPNESNFDFTDSMTVAAWIKVNSFTTDWQAIITKGGDGSWRLQRYGSTNHIDFGTSGLSNGDLEGTTDVTDGNWHYIAGVFDGSTKYLYVDGNLDASVSVTGTISTTNGPVEIATNSDWSGRNFDGLIDEVRIWNGPRTQTEIQNHMNNVLTGNESGLVAYYKFDMSSGTYLYDHTGNGNLGKLHNMANNDWVASGWTVTYNASWTGAVNTDWKNVGNWSGKGEVPASTDDVDIPNTANQPVINAGDTAVCHNLTVENGASLTIASNATGNGALMMTGSNAGEVTVQRYITGYTTNDNGWHTVAAPFNMAVSTSNFLPGASDDLYAWNEVAWQWDNYKVSSFNFERGRGYLVAYNDTVTHNMAGTLSSSDVTLTNLSYTPSKGNGWQLLGNPFPCPVKWNDGNWTLNNVGAQAQIYNEAAGNYTVLSENDTIPSTNAFFVQVDSASNSITIPAASRTFSSVNNFKSQRENRADSSMNLKVTGEANSYYDVAKVRFRNNATSGWDKNYDAHKMFGAETAPQLWSVSENENFALNTLPPPEDDFTLPLNFRTGVNSVYHLTWNGIKSIPVSWKVQLEDMLTDKAVNMRLTSVYDFTAATTDDPGRFVLHINGPTGISNPVNSDRLSVYATGNEIWLKASGNERLTGRVAVYNMLGQQVYRTRLNGTKQQTIYTGLDTGIYIVRVLKDNTFLLAKKIVIR